jgi:hypothetical protein
VEGFFHDDFINPQLWRNAMVTNTQNGPKREEPTIARELLMVQLATYSKIVSRKHGIAPRFSVDDVAEWTDDQISTYVEALRDLAHLPAS